MLTRNVCIWRWILAGLLGLMLPALAPASLIQVNGPLVFTVGAQGQPACFALDATTNATFLGMLTEPTQPGGMALHGSYLSLATTDDGLLILNPGAQFSPTVVRSFATYQSYHDLVIADDIAFLAEAGDQVVLLDLAEPQQPHFIGSISLDQSPTGLAFTNNLLYVAAGTNGLTIFNVSNPELPETLGAYPTPYLAHRVKIAGDRAYLISANSRLDILNIQNPANPTLLGTFQPTNPTSDFDAAGNNLALVSTNGGFAVLNFANPVSPVLLASNSIAGGATAVRLIGNRALIRRATGELLVVPLPGLSATPLRLLSAVAPVTTVLGATTVMSVQVEGNLPVHLQWFHNGVALTNSARIAGVNTPYLRLTDTSLSDAGIYTVAASNSVNTLVSSNLLTVVFPGAPLPKGLVNWGEAVLGVERNEFFTFTATETQGLQVVDVSNPRHPHYIGRTATAGSAQSLVAAGELLFLALGSSGLEIHTVANPYAPSLLTSVALPGFATDLAIGNGQAFVAAGAAGLHVLHLGDIESPQLLSTYDTPGNASSVALFNQLALVADGAAGLQILSIANPSSPQLIGHYPVPGQSQRVRVVGNYAYVAAGTGGLTILNLSNPSAPTWVATYSTPGPVWDVQVFAHYALLACGTNGLEILNLANPAAPVRIAQHSQLGDARQLRLFGTSVAVAAGTAGMRLVELAGLIPSHPEITLPPVPQILLPTQHVTFTATASGAPPLHYQWFKDDQILFDQTRRTGSATPQLTISNLAYADSAEYRIVVRNDWNLTASASASLQVVPVGTPVFRGGYFDVGDVLNVQLVGNLAYLANRTRGLQIVDCRNPQLPELLATRPTGDLAQDVHVQGRFAYVANWTSGLAIFDISQPTNPVHLASCAIPGLAHHVRVAEGFAYVAARSGGFALIDVRNPHQPTLASRTLTGGFAEGVAPQDRHLFVAAGSAGLEIYSITNPLAPRWLGALNTPGHTENLLLLGAHAYLADYNSGLHVANVSQPGQPTLVGSYQTRGDAFQVQIMNQRAYVAEGLGRVAVLEITNPAAPALITTSLAGDSVRGLQVVGQHAFLADRESGLLVTELLGLPPAPPSCEPLVGPTNVAEGGELHLSVAATGTPPFSYQWWKDSQPLAAAPNRSGITTPHLRITQLGAADAGDYSVIISTPHGSVTSAVQTISVQAGSAAAPEISFVTQPESRQVLPGATVQFSAVPTGAAPLLWHWFRDGVPLQDDGRVSGVTSTQLTIVNATFADAGRYQLRVLGPAGITNSSVAVLSLLGPLQQQIDALPNGATLHLPAGQYSETLVITQDLTLKGNWWDQPLLSGGTAGPALRIAPGARVTLRGLAIGQSQHPEIGGGIYNEGELTLEYCLVTDNTALNGGGIANYGTLHLHQTILSNNLATDCGGGLFNAPFARLNATNSTFIGNHANQGGGIYNLGTNVFIRSLLASNLASGLIGQGGGFRSLAGQAQFINSTISGNLALSSNPDLEKGSGGGLLLTGGRVEMHFVTVTQNRAQNYGGGADFNAQTELFARNTIFAANTATIGADLSDTLISGGHNLIGNTAFTTISGDLTGNQLNVEAQLGPLQDNGGPTLTHAPRPTSPVIDAGAAPNPLSDGRDAPRPFDVPWIDNVSAPAPDIGAVEYLDSSPYLVIASQTATGFQLHWTTNDVLQRATSLTAPWLDQTNSSPLFVLTTTNLQGFFRLRRPELPVLLQTNHQDADGFQLSWSQFGILERAPTPEGPWQPVTGLSPVRVHLRAGDNEFFRLRVLPH